MYETYFPVVVQAVEGDNKTIYAYFSDGHITRYDMKPLIKKGGIFSILSDDDFFSKALTVLNDTVAWDLSGCYDSTKCIDIDPFVLYEAEKVSDPLAEVV
jgi:hypothetical protein